MPTGILFHPLSTNGTSCLEPWLAWNRNWSKWKGVAHLTPPMLFIGKFTPPSKSRIRDLHSSIKAIQWPHSVSILIMSYQHLLLSQVWTPPLASCVHISIYDTRIYKKQPSECKQNCAWQRPWCGRQEEGLELCVMDKGYLRDSLRGSSFTSKPFRTENKTLCVATQDK